MLIHHEHPPPLQLPTPPLIASSFLPIRRHHRRCEDADAATASPAKMPTLPPPLPQPSPSTAAPDDTPPAPSPPPPIYSWYLGSGGPLVGLGTCFDSGLISFESLCCFETLEFNVGFNTALLGSYFVEATRIHSVDDYFMTEVEKVDEIEVSKSVC
nr:hypothetical protein Itr_chr09CG09900 [Ipomoea trifida]